MNRLLDLAVEDAVHVGNRTVNDIVAYVKGSINQVDERYVRRYAMELLDLIEESPQLPFRS